MNIGLIDVDGHNFPNLSLMKISSYHKEKGDNVEWCNLFKHYDRVYQAKVFSDTYSPDLEYTPNADEIIKGGTGYAITNVNGKELYNPELDKPLPYEIEHQYPDYSLYADTGLTKDTAYGFLTRGCPRNCDFCIVAKKEGRCSFKVADLNEFWKEQKNIKLLDPNILACKEHISLLEQLVNSKAYVDFTQGIDIRLTNEDNISLINQIKVKEIHFAWDNPKEDLEKFFIKYKQQAKHKPHGHFGTVYCLTNFNSTFDEDLYRIYSLRDWGFNPYVMIYDKPNAPHKIKQLQRWCNNKYIFRSVLNFSDYDAKK